MAHFKCFMCLFFALLLISQKALSELLHLSPHPMGTFWISEDGDNRCLSSVEPPTKFHQTCVSPKNPEHLILPYQKMILGSLYFVNPHKILIIGLGGGTLVKALGTLCPKAEIDIVDIHPDTPRIAGEYFFFSPSSHMKIFIQDGADFITHKKGEEIYDLIIIDAFSGEYNPSKQMVKGLCFPDPFREASFVQKVKSLLTPKGVAVFNTISQCPSHVEDIAQYRQSFDQLFLFALGNEVIIAPKNFWGNTERAKKEAQKWEKRFGKTGVSQEWLLPKLKLFHPSPPVAAEN